ncbi:MAG: hypothetical protein HQL24_07545 [Candidatus Omnitrophica bacterium]|nr:hypothetical protein [Candidatus Omnitrophota bacterium]
MAQNKNPFQALKLASSILLENKAILFPYVVIAFIQLLLLEIFYFAPRHPLNLFFGPIIKKLWSDNYLHYPLNFVLLPTLFQNLQLPVYILVSSYFMAASINILVAVNNGDKLRLGNIYKKTFASYVHIIIAAAISVGVSLLFLKGYELILNRALIIRSESGLYGNIKKLVIYGAPYFNLLLNILATCIVVYILPIIVIDRKNVFKALFLNIKMLFRSFFFTIFIVLVPSMLYVVIILLKNSDGLQSTAPELSAVIMACGILFVTIIDAVVYTTVSTNYLLGKEEV